MNKKKNIIIQKNSNLFCLDIKNIDPKAVSFLEEVYFLNYQKDKGNECVINRFIKLLDAFCYLKKYNLKYIILINKDLTKLLSEYNFFLQFCVEMNAIRFIRILDKVVQHLNQNHGRNIVLENKVTFNFSQFDTTSIKYLNGWKIKPSNRISYEYIQLNKYCDIHGFDSCEEIESTLIKVNQFFPVHLFNKFISYINNDKSSIFNLEKRKLIEFLQFHFTSQVNINLYSRKKEWNFLIDLLTNHFALNEKYDLKFFNKGSKSPNEMRVKTVNDKQYKDKLISLVPLEIKDEKALSILKDKVNQDIQIIVAWAKQTIEEIKQSRLTLRCLKSDDYNISPEELRSNYGFKNHNLNKDIFDIETNFNEKHLFATCALLIVEHPEITESFLKKSSFSDSLVHGMFSENLFLISKKSRKGDIFAEQKILLNDKTLPVLNDYLHLTKELRKNLVKFNHTEKEMLFVCCSNNHPLEIKQPLEFKTSYVQKSIYSFLTDKGYSDDESQYYSNSINLSKIRSSRAVQIYFNTENTSKMAEALGHHKYNANLLSHYLPKSILDFFQERWIRVFQKGIILESVNNSDFILEATKFDTMEEVNEFIKNHTFKFNANKNEHKEEINLIVNKTSYISINEVNLKALVSIYDAVKESPNKELINENAFYWSSFYEKLKQTIETDYTNFYYLIEISSKNSKPNLFKEAIYA